MWGPAVRGKTTLLQIMGTLDKADTGTILLNGTEVSCLKEKELSAFRNRQIGFVFQFHQLLPEFTALENVMMPALIAGTSSSEAMRKAKETLAFWACPNVLRTNRLNYREGRSNGWR